MCKQGFFVSTQCHVYFYYLTFLVLAKQGDDYFILRYSQEGERKKQTTEPRNWPGQVSP